MLNFADNGIHPIVSGSTKTYPDNFAIAATPSGMWHQFGTIPKGEVGVHISVDDISKNWLKYHYKSNYEPSVYNNYQGQQWNNYENVLSLADLVGFDKGNKKKLGQIKKKKTIREAVVAIPYIIEEIQDPVAGRDTRHRKFFIEIPRQRYEAALQAGTPIGDSFATAGASISKQLQKMNRYVFPPQLDFINNPQGAASPFVMYIFEFEYNLDQDDLSYIWQNLAPREFEKLTFQQSSVAHELMDTELLNEYVLEENQHLRWMVFKVKQKSQDEYWNYTDMQVNKNSNQRYEEQFGGSRSGGGYKYIHNWPYDYLSFVEAIKVNCEIKFSASQEKTQQRQNMQYNMKMVADPHMADILAGVTPYNPDQILKPWEVPGATQQMGGEGEPWWTPGDEGEPWFANFPLGSFEYSPVVSKGTHGNKNEGDDEEDDEADKDFTGTGGKGGGGSLPPEFFPDPPPPTIFDRPPLPGDTTGGGGTKPGVTIFGGGSIAGGPGGGFGGGGGGGFIGGGPGTAFGGGVTITKSTAADDGGNGWSVRRTTMPASQLSMMQDAVKKNKY